jgi:hypothetical protein
MVESFQLANLITMEFTQHTKYSPFYIPVTDKKIINRLNRRLDHWYEREAQRGAGSH